MPSYDPGNSRQIIAALTGDPTSNSQINRCLLNVKGIACRDRLLSGSWREKEVQIEMTSPDRLRIETKK